MKITFFSNFLNHHQLPFCEAMYSRLGEGYKFIATESIPEERLKLGYIDMNKQYPFVLTTYDSDSNRQEAMRLAKESDVVIIGSAPEIYVRKRIKENKLTFKYSERIYKKGLKYIFSPRYILHMLMRHTIYRKKNVFMLCASAYAAGDFALMGAYKDKTYKWGYFTEYIEYDINELMKKKQSETINILWAGRFIDWKHPEKAIYVAKRLKEDGYRFKLNMIGTGDMQEHINLLILDYNLSEEVELHGSMSPEKVRANMENSNIFLFTSDYQEGWGAVLNEAMNSGCAVVASHKIGSVPFMINNNKNGVIYDDDDDLYTNVKNIIDNKEIMYEFGKNAYLDIEKIWNAEIATERFINLCIAKLNNNNIDIDSGPCSIAENIQQKYMYQKIKI